MDAAILAVTFQELHLEPNSNRGVDYQEQFNGGHAKGSQRSRKNSSLHIMTGCQPTKNITSSIKKYPQNIESLCVSRK